MNRPFVAENARERERLRALVGRMTDEELRLPLGDGWTISSALAHLAFWDRRSLVLMRRWKESGVSQSPIDQDVVNESILPLCAAIPPRAAAALAVSSAEAIDRELEEAPDALVAAIERLGDRFRLYRADHRKLHLDGIESALSRLGGAS